MDLLVIIAIALPAFLLGSIPFGILLAKVFGLADPRTIGSGNIGATNMLRTGRKGVALLTLLLDMGKGALAVVTAGIAIPSAWIVEQGMFPYFEKNPDDAYIIALL